MDATQQGSITFPCLVRYLRASPAGSAQQQHTGYSSSSSRGGTAAPGVGYSSHGGGSPPAPTAPFGGGAAVPYGRGQVQELWVGQKKHLLDTRTNKVGWAGRVGDAPCART